MKPSFSSKNLMAAALVLATVAAPFATFAQEPAAHPGAAGTGKNFCSTLDARAAASTANIDKRIAAAKTADTK